MKLFLTDLDATLTDGTDSVSSKDGTITKRFHTRDFVGMRQLHEKGIRVAIVTGWPRDAIIQYQFERTQPWADLLCGVDDKLTAIKETYPDIDLEDIAFIGDDTNDLELLKAVGVASCPSDAHEKVLQYIRERSDNFICDAKGGHGCVREFADYVLDIVYNSAEEK